MAHPITEVAKFMRLGKQYFPATTDKGIHPNDVDKFLERCYEEYLETVDATWNREGFQTQVKIPEALDGFIDLAYVAMTGAIRLVGEDKAKQAWDAVVKANLSKVDGSIGPRRFDRETGKILKPEGWTAPDIEGIVNA